MKTRVDRFLFYSIFSIIIGVIIGIIDAIFSIGLTKLSNFRIEYFMKLIYFLPIVGIFIVYSYKKYGKNSSKGMGYVFEASEISDTIIPTRLIPFSIISTWLTHLFGGSAGREGVAVQIGATVANNFSTFLERKFKLNLKEFKKILICSGISAGFAGLFGTPLAGTIFALEVLKMGAVEYRALFPALASAFSAYFISIQFGLKHFHFSINTIPEKNMKNILLFLLSSLIFAVTGYLFAFTLKHFKGNKIISTVSPVKKIFFGGLLLSILLIICHQGRYSGLGTNLIHSSFYGEKIYSYDFILKLLFTIFTLGIGFQGGEVTPIFSIGASLGAFLATLLGLPSTFLACIGYCSVFASATNTFLACFFIGIEIFGYQVAGYLFVACAISYLFSGEISIYEAQKKEHFKI